MKWNMKKTYKPLEERYRYYAKTQMNEYYGRLKKRLDQNQKIIHFFHVQKCAIVQPELYKNSFKLTKTNSSYQ